MTVSTSTDATASAIKPADYASEPAGQDAVDGFNADFYGRIQYPWPPAYYERLARPDLWSKMIGQDIGWWDTPVVPSGGRVWVAGCGRNQAVITALKFPKAHVVASDLSEPSLAASRDAARRLGIKNLELRCESLNHVHYESEFDYTICTGVIHHNSDPQVPMRNVARATKRSGVMELMVYNEYHRLATAAFQKAARAFLGNSAAPQYEEELALAQRFVDVASSTTLDDWRSGPSRAAGLGTMLDFLAVRKGRPISEVADALIQPVEHRYDMRRFQTLVTECGAEVLHFRVDEFSRTAGALTWNMRFPDERLQSTYDGLGDLDRWQITNLLTMQDSPMIWFYCQRTDSGRRRKSEQQLNTEFLSRRFKRISTTCELIPAPSGREADPRSMHVAFPRGRPDSTGALKVLEHVAATEPLGATFERLGMRPGTSNVNELRVQLATSAFPFLESV